MLLLSHWGARGGSSIEGVKGRKPDKERDQGQKEQTIICCNNEFLKPFIHIVCLSSAANSVQRQLDGTRGNLILSKESEVRQRDRPAAAGSGGRRRRRPTAAAAVATVLP